MRAVKPKLAWDGRFDHITQECPKSRVRFDPQVVPEILAWLMGMADRYGKMLEHLAKVNMRDQTAKSLEAMRDAEVRCDMIAELMLMVPDMWNAHLFNECCITVDKVLKSGKLTVQKSQGYTTTVDLPTEG